MARAINRVLKRRGRVWGARYHSHTLRTPREVRSALVYVLQNFRKHVRGATGIDPRSSAAWFQGWRTIVAAPLAIAPVVAARTWLARVGWRRYGLIDVGDAPAAGSTQSPGDGSVARRRYRADDRSVRRRR
jgi:hypothetical protein